MRENTATLELPIAEAARAEERDQRSETEVEVVAAKLRVKARRDEDGEWIIPGKLGHIYQHDVAGRVFGLSLDNPMDNPRLDNRLRARKRKALAAGFELWVEGDFEATLLFDPMDMKQAQLAVKLVGAKRLRKTAPPTEAQLRARALFASRARPKLACLGVETPIST